MRIEGIELAAMEEAVRVYLDLAWEDEAETKAADLDFASAATPDEVLSRWTEDRRMGRMRRYTLRLGNTRYPFMKLVFQELLIRGRFFFAVDTHDNMDIKDSFPDYDQWLEVKRFNSQFKESIERAWREREVPTFATIVEQVERETAEIPIGGVALNDYTFAEVNNTKGLGPAYAVGKFDGICGMGWDDISVDGVTTPVRALSTAA